MSAYGIARSRNDFFTYALRCACVCVWRGRGLNIDMEWTADIPCILCIKSRASA